MAKSYRERTEELIRKAKEDFRRKKLAEYMGAKHGDRAVEGPDEEWQHEQPGGDFGSVAPSGWDDPMPEGMSSIPTVHEYDNIEREIEAKRLEKANRKQDKEEEGTSGERGESGSALDEFEAKAKASDGFIEEKPQPTFEEQQQAEEKEAAEPMPELENEILSDAEAQALAGSVYEEGDPRLQEEGRVYPEEEGKSSDEILKDRAASREADNARQAETQAEAKEIAEAADERIHQEVLRDMGHGQSFDTSLGAPLATDTTRELAQEQKKAGVYDQMSDERNREIEYAENIIRNVGSGGAISPEDSEHVQRYKEEQAAKQAQRDDERRRGTHRYIGDQAYEDDIRVAKEAQARQKARGPDAQGYERLRTEPPMTNSKGEKLPAKTYDPKLGYIEDVVVDGVVVDRMYKDHEGARELEGAEQQKAGKVWVIPTKHGFRLGSPEAAGQGPGHWVRPDQAERMVATVADRQEREDEVTELKRLRNRTPLEVREDQLREQREHELAMQRIEFNQDDDLEDQAKKEMEIARIDKILATPGLSAEDRAHWESERIRLLGGGEVGAGAAPAAPGAPAAGGFRMEADDITNDLGNYSPDLEPELDALMADYVDDSDGYYNFNPMDAWQSVEAGLGGEFNVSDEMNLEYMAKKLAEMISQGSINPDTIKAVGAKLMGMDGAVRTRLGKPAQFSDEAGVRKWKATQKFYEALLANPPRLPENTQEIMDMEMGIGWFGQPGGWGG